MNRIKLSIALAIVLAAALTALVIWLPDRAGAIAQGLAPQDEVALAGTVNSRISYQGILKESGSPVTGNRDMTFRLYTDGDCTNQVGADIIANGVSVTDGLFSVKLEVGQSLFNGQGLWLGVDVGNTGVNVTCEEIVPVPYALSLRPGAVISGSLPGPLLTLRDTYYATTSMAADIRPTQWGSFSSTLEIDGDIWVGGDTSGKAAAFEGEVWVNAKVYVEDLHTTSTGHPDGAPGASINSNGDATFRKVTVPNSATTTEINEHKLVTKNNSDGMETFSVDTEHGNVNILGYLTVMGAKSAVVSTESYGQRKFYTDESAGVYFFDRGQAQLVNGQVTIALDPIFLETVTIDADHPLLVQITLTGDCHGVYVAEKTATGFTVKELMGGTSNATFDWEVAAKRRGYENVRLEPFTSP